MHIAHFTNYYLPVINGVVRSIHSFREALSRKGHNVFIFAQDADYEDREPFIFRYPSIKLPINVPVRAAIPISHFIDELIPRLKLDVIHAHHPILLGQTAVIKARELDLPLVFTFHTQYREYTHYFPIPNEPFQQFLKTATDGWLRSYMRRCQHVIVPSESMLALLERNFGLRDRCTVIPTGITPPPDNPSHRETFRRLHEWSGDIVMVSIGRLAPEKNWTVLIRAVDIVLRDHPRFRLVLIGDGPEREHLEQLVADLGIGHRVTFVGQLPFAEVPPYMKAADLFGFASITETQGLVTLEAMAASLPIVAVDSCGVKDLVTHGHHGYLVENDPGSLAAGIARVLDDPQRMHQLGASACRKAREFHIDAMTDKLLAVYERAIHDKKLNRVVELA